MLERIKEWVTFNQNKDVQVTGLKAVAVSSVESMFHDLANKGVDQELLKSMFSKYQKTMEDEKNKIL